METRMSPLLTQTAELALDLLEKNKVLLVFCKAVQHDGHTVSIMPDAGGNLAEDSVRIELRRRAERREIKQFTICSDVTAKFAGEPAPQRRLKIELQDGTAESGIYYFPMQFDQDCISLGKYAIADLVEKMI